MVITKVWMILETKILEGKRGWGNFLSGERSIGVHPGIKVQTLSSHDMELFICHNIIFLLEGVRT
jgi:hypothetical protein